MSKDDKQVQFTPSSNENLIDFNEEFDRKKNPKSKVHSGSRINNEDALFEIDDDDNSNDSDYDDDSDLSSIVLSKSKRITLRKSKIWTRRNINEIENNEAERKRQEKMAIPHRVVDKMEKNELELGNMIDEARHFIEGKYLSIHENEREQALTADNIYRNSKSNVKETLKKINKKFIEIDNKWKITNEKEDKLVKHEDITILKDQTLQLLTQKDDIIHALMEELDDLSFKFLNEVSSNSSALIKLNDIAKNKINILKNEHDKQNLEIKKLIDDEKRKIKNKDSFDWKLLSDNIITKILSMERLPLIKDKEIELIKLFEIHEKDVQKNRIAHVKKTIGMNADFEKYKFMCTENTEQLKYDCSFLKQRIEENSITVVRQRRRIVALQELKGGIKKKIREIESEHETQIPIIKKQIIDINERINQKEKTANLIAKKNNCEYTQLWQLQQNDLISRITKLNKIDYLIREFLGICKTPISREKPVIEIVPACWKPFNLNQDSLLNDNLDNITTSNTYVYARDRALNKLLMDFILKNSSFVFDYTSNEILDTNLMQNLPYPYNALSVLKLKNEDTWNLMKSKLKPFVICNVCKSEVNWKFDDSHDLEQHNSTNTKLHHRTKEFQSDKSVDERLSTHINRHYEKIDLVCPLNSEQLNQNIVLNTNEEEEEEEEEVKDNSTTTIETYTNHKCVDVNHELFIDNKHFMPILIEVIKITRFKSKRKIKSLEERLAKTYDFLQWKLSENDLQEYWSKLMNFVPNTIDSWEVFHQAIKRYSSDLLARQAKFSKLKKLQSHNEELSTIISQLTVDN